jgi:TonB family protein
VDVVILEIMTILFWWNPLVWFYKKSLRTVHEYLADDAVLQTTQKKQYGQLLIRQSHSGMQIALANNFIQSQLKNRIMMMMKSKSQSQQLWKYLLFLPVFGLLFMTFSCENARAQSENDERIHPVSKAKSGIANPDDEVFKVVDEMPRFAGTVTEGLTTETEKQQASNKLMLEYIYTNVEYPKNARKEGVEGMTVVRFVVGKSGELRDFEVLREVHPDLGAEALRVAKTMPDWIPGRQRGKAVSVQFNLPIKFKLADEEQEETITQKVDNQPKELDIRDFKAFPNPASDKVTVQFSTNEKIVEVKIIDANGQCFSTMNVMNLDKENMDWKSEEIDVSKAARGMLLIQMQNEKGDKMRTEKVILQ